MVLLPDNTLLEALPCLLDTPMCAGLIAAVATEISRKQDVFKLILISLALQYFQMESLSDVIFEEILHVSGKAEIKHSAGVAICTFGNKAESEQLW